MDSLNLVYRDKPRFCLHSQHVLLPNHLFSLQDMVDVPPSPLTLRPVSKPLFSTSKSVERKLNTSQECKGCNTHLVLPGFYHDFTKMCNWSVPLLSANRPWPWPWPTAAAGQPWRPWAFQWCPRWRNRTPRYGQRPDLTDVHHPGGSSHPAQWSPSSVAYDDDFPAEIIWFFHIELLVKTHMVNKNNFWCQWTTRNCIFMA